MYVPNYLQFWRVRIRWPFCWLLFTARVSRCRIENPSPEGVTGGTVSLGKISRSLPSGAPGFQAPAPLSRSLFSGRIPRRGARRSAPQSTRDAGSALHGLLELRPRLVSGDTIKLPCHLRVGPFACSLRGTRLRALARGADLSSNFLPPWDPSPSLARGGPLSEPGRCPGHLPPPRGPDSGLAASAPPSLLALGNFLPFPLCSDKN